MVTTYDALADVILGANKAEKKLVRSILAATYGHAQSELGRARQALKSGDAAAAKAAVGTWPRLSARSGPRATTPSRACASGCSRGDATTTPPARPRGSTTKATWS